MCWRCSWQLICINDRNRHVWVLFNLSWNQLQSHLGNAHDFKNSSRTNYCHAWLQVAECQRPVTKISLLCVLENMAEKTKNFLPRTKPLTQSSISTLIVHQVGHMRWDGADFGALIATLSMQAKSQENVPNGPSAMGTPRSFRYWLHFHVDISLVERGEEYATVPSTTVFALSFAHRCYVSKMNRNTRS